MVTDGIPMFKVFMNQKISEYLNDVLLSGYIGQGPKVEEFEAELKERLGFSSGVTVNSGTSALMLALQLIGVGPGDEVVSTPMTCLATNAVISLTGADIVWADIDEYGNISPESVRQKISHKTKAVMAVDWGGLPADYDGLRNAIRDSGYDIPIVEDAAHAFGARYRNKPISVSGGDYVCFSFQAIKHVTCGDGGLLVVPDELYERAKLLRWYGFDRSYSDRMRCIQDVTEIGNKLHMNDINATIGLANLRYSDWIVNKHRVNAAYYDTAFMDVGLLPPWPRDRESSYWLYTIHIPDPPRFEAYMAENNVMVSKVHNRNDLYTVYKRYVSNLPVLDEWFRTMICLPVGWWMTKSHLDKVISLTLQYLDEFKTRQDGNQAPRGSLYGSW